MKKIFYFSILIFSSVFAKDLTTIEDTKMLCETSTKYMNNGDYKRAFDNIRPHWGIPDAEIDNMINQTEMQSRMIIPRFGNSIGIDFISTERKGKSFVKHFFVSKYDNHIINFICIFYKPKNKWKVNSVYWNDKVAELFKK